LSNFVNFFGVPMQYGPLWSLAVEEQFYLLWPSAVNNLSKKWLGFCALAVFVASPFLRAILFALGHTAEGGYTWLVADGLAGGALLAILSRTILAERASMKRFCALCIGASVLLMALGFQFGMFSPTALLGASLRRTLFGALFTGVLSLALLLGTSRWAWIAQRPVLQFFGEISYGLYLIHTLVFDITDHFSARFVPSMDRLAVQGHFAMMVVRFLVAAGLSVVLAFLSRRYFEDRFLKLKDRWTAAVLDPSPAPEERVQAATQVA
jgi:peptidoglycan/LPS O-acetylase OafA/YrhL